MPIGRYDWRDRDRRVLNDLAEGARTQQENWPPVRDRLFASASRFLELVAAFNEKVLPHLHWY
jgi:hypothetical protein